MSGHPAGTPWATVDELRKRHDEAAADPRVGDRWILPAAIHPLTCNVVCVGDNVQVLYCCEPKYMTKDRFADWLKKTGWTLAARGPAPATPARDPATTPVVGDEWQSPLKNWTAKVIDDGAWVEIDFSVQGPPRTQKWRQSDFATISDGWTLHRKGDDPNWRPEGEPFEQPAAGIKVGDRVKNKTGDYGVVDEITTSGRVWVKYDDGQRTWMLLDDWHQAWTIIPPAAAPDPDDTGDEPPTPAFEGDPSAERFATYQSDPAEEQLYRDSKYIRSIRSVNGKESIDVDVYEVLEAFSVTCPARAHAVKKLLCAGIRNKGSVMQDLREAAACVQRAMEMQHQREAAAAAKGKQ